MINVEPKHLDQVKNKISGVVGTVIAKYPGLGGDKNKNFVDVRTIDDDIWYESPAINWEVTKEYNEDD